MRVRTAGGTISRRIIMHVGGKYQMRWGQWCLYRVIHVVSDFLYQSTLRSDFFDFCGLLYSNDDDL